jgi:hypothetical protein
MGQCRSAHGWPLSVAAWELHFGHADKVEEGSRKLSMTLPVFPVWVKAEILIGR